MKKFASIALLSLMAGFPLHAALADTLINIQASTESKIKNDVMRVTLFTVSEGKDPGEVSEKNTLLLNKAIAIIKENPAIDVAIGNRGMNPKYTLKLRKEGDINTRESVLSGWEERVTLSLESEDMSAVSSAMAKVMGDLKLGSIDFTVSNAARKAEEVSVTAKTIQAFHENARNIVTAMGAESYKIVSLNVSPLSSGHNYRPVMMKSMAADMSESTPMSVEGGSTELTQSVSGEISIRQVDYSGTVQ